MQGAGYEDSAPPRVKAIIQSLALRGLFHSPAHLPLPPTLQTELLLRLDVFYECLKLGIRALDQLNTDAQHECVWQQGSSSNPQCL